MQERERDDGTADLKCVPAPPGEAWELALFKAALDQIKTGVLLLDRDMHAVYANAAGGAMFNTPLNILSLEYVMTERPHYGDMLRRSKPAIATDCEHEAYIQKRMQWVQSADATPMDFVLADGRTIR